MLSNHKSYKRKEIKDEILTFREKTNVSHFKYFIHFDFMPYHIIDAIVLRYFQGTYSYNILTRLSSCRL